MGPMALDTLTFTWPDTAIRIAVVLALAVATRWLVQLAIRKLVAMSTERARSHWEFLGRPGRLLAQAAGSENERQRQRAATMGSVLGSAATFLIAAVVILTVLSDIGIDLTAVLASASVGGVALAFGAQSLVKDILSGIFLIVEDQYGVGDLITVNDVTGTVEHVGLRITSVRDGNGMLWYLRNGEITKLGNVSQGWSMATIDVPVAPSADAEQAIAVLQQVCAQVAEDPAVSDQLIEPPEVLGVQTLTAQAMTLRISAKCVANNQWGIEREVLEQAKTALDAAGVKQAWQVPHFYGSSTPPASS